MHYIKVVFEHILQNFYVYILTRYDYYIDQI